MLRLSFAALALMSGHSIKLVDPDATTRSVQSVSTQEAVTANFTQTDEGAKAISTIPLVGTEDKKHKGLFFL